MRISEAKGIPKRQELRTQIVGKYNLINSEINNENE
jgi:hypothetical protein